ncbi:MAG: cytidine deaminase [Firmicutes bacterium]|nr:cytidine deaminase [Bacillota bacterium]
MDVDKLLESAREMLPFAYAPYSGYRVGAALLTTEGKIFKGVNVENASLGLTMCAERVALYAAIAAGYRSFSLLALVAEGESRPLPCGACRQVLGEFSRGLRVAVAGEKGESKIFTLKELLPHPFVLQGRK